MSLSLSLSKVFTWNAHALVQSLGQVRGKVKETQRERERGGECDIVACRATMYTVAHSARTTVVQVTQWRMTGGIINIALEMMNEGHTVVFLKITS